MDARRGQGGGWATLAPVLAILVSGPAVVAQRPCPTLTVEADRAVRTRWPDLAARIREAFGGREDVDACAGVRLGMRGRAVEVAVRLPDGRSASRLVRRPADVEPTLAALLLVPERSAAGAEPERAPAPSPEPAPPAVASPEPERRAASAAPARHARAQPADVPAPAVEPSGVGVEFSVITGARAGDGMVSAGLGALTLLDVSPVLIGVEGRAEGYSEFAMTQAVIPTLSLAALGGYRLRSGTTALDLMAGLGLAMIAADESKGPAPELARERAPRLPAAESGFPLVPRLAAAAHYRFAMHSALRTFVGLDGQVGLARAGGNVSGGGSRLPLWTVGLVAGATVGGR